MNLKLNSLPSRTWNRLGMNESFLEVEGDLRNHTPGAVWDQNELNWTPASDWDEDGNRIALAMGEDMRTLTAGADTGLAETAAGTVMKGNLVLTWDYAEGEESCSRVVLHAAGGSTLNVIQVFRTPESDSSCLSAVRTEIHAEAGATVNLYVAQLLGSGSICLNDISGVCDEGAAVNLVRLELGSGKLYSGVQTDLKGRESRFTADTAYHVLPGQLLDMNYVALHHGQRTESLMEVNGTLEENARKIFRGTIDFQRGCAGSKGTENENVLLLSEELVNQTIPLILCKEEDVEGNHGASIGKLDDKVLFYLSTRGIPEQEAQKIIARSRVEAVCAKIPDEEIRAEAHAFEEKRGNSHGDEV